jgi:hypothetical protein
LDPEPHDLGADHFERIERTRLAARLTRKLAELGFQVTRADRPVARGFILGRRQGGSKPRSELPPGYLTLPLPRRGPLPLPAARQWRG